MVNNTATSPVVLISLTTFSEFLFSVRRFLRGKGRGGDVYS